MSMNPVPQIVVVNESTLIKDPNWLFNLIWSLNYQLRWQAAPLWKLMAEVLALEPGKPVPSGAWILHLIDKITDAPNALGYHDEDGNEVPFGRVGIETSLDNNCQPSEVASHELLEMLVDPHVNATAFDPKSGRLYAMEVGDPVQGGAYDLGAPYQRATGWIMSDFALPGWFDPNTPASRTTSYRHTVKGPFALGSGGYVGYATSLPPDWQQEMGEHANKAIADADDRVSRRAAR